MPKGVYKRKTKPTSGRYRVSFGKVPKARSYRVSISAAADSDATVRKSRRKQRGQYTVAESTVTITGHAADETDKILHERANVHGRWEDNARISRAFRAIVEEEVNKRPERFQAKLTPSEREAIDMIVHKISRIIAGDPRHADHWDDIGGYARLGRDGHQ